MKCFVIQPFDKGKFDARYRDTFLPAIRGANCDPDRVDMDPSVEIPIERIESGIRESDLCFAEITTNNANVWFEVGFAIACGKPICLVCSDERADAYPFDVRHRRILQYQTRSVSDYEEAKAKISERLKALAAGIVLQAPLPITLSDVGIREGLAAHEAAVLAAVCVFGLENEYGMSGYLLGGLLEKEYGFTKLAARLAAESLVRKKMLIPVQEETEVGEPFIGYKVAEAGMSWLLENQGTLKLHKTAANQGSQDEDIPF